MIHDHTYHTRNGGPVMAANEKEDPLSGFASGLGLPLSWSPGWLTEFSPDHSPHAVPGTAEAKPKAKEQEKEAGG